MSTDRADRTLRYKLYEMAHYAGSVILEIGLSDNRNAGLAIRAASEAGENPQYFGIDADAETIEQARQLIRKKRLESRALFLQGTLSQFRNLIPVVPTMVVVNSRENIDSILRHLGLFLASGTPVLATHWFESRSDGRSIPEQDNFEFCGRFGESVLLQSTAEVDERPVALTDVQFQQLRQQLSASIDGTLARLEGPILGATNRNLAANPPSGKQWPFSKNTIHYPATLPDGTPWPKISIVTPTFNQGKYIEQTIHSIINQDYPNVEYIVVDGGSSDATPEILDRHRAVIDHLIAEPDDGQSDAINKGMKLATGSILTWLNSDDMLTPGTLYAMAMAFWKSKADMVVGTAQMLKDGKIVEEHLTSCEDGPLQLPELLDLDNNWLQGRFFFQPELMFTRDLWERAGGYVDPSLYFSMDHELWLRFAVAGASMHIIGRPTAIYRLHDEQKTQADYRPELRTVNRRYIEKYGVPKPAAPALQPKKYRAAFVNDVGPRYGAGIAHGRLRDAIDAAGHENIFICARPSDSETKTAAQVYSEIEAFNPDIVILGNLHLAGLEMDLVDRVSASWATIFVLHDMWATTGRCCYSGSCEKYLTACDSACPTADQYPALQPEQIEPAFQRKLAVMSQPRRLMMMANSHWTRERAERSAIGSRSIVRTLKYAFPTDVFAPRDKKMCREILGLPQEKFIVLFASVNVAEDRKGLRHLFEALNRLDIEDLLPVCVGNSYDISVLHPGTIAMGYVDDPWRAALIHAAADVFVGPSLQEAFGQVFIEAAACGTPAIGYATGGVQEAIVDGVTGLLAQRLHPSALAETINRLYSDAEYRRQLGVWGRIEIENEWSLRSAYHHFNNLLRQVPERIGFLPPVKTRFLPAGGPHADSTSGRSFSILRRGENSVLPGSGFSPPENFRQRNGSKSKIRWVVEPLSELTVRVVEDGQFGLWLKCRNPCRDQLINVWCDDQLVNRIRLDTAEDFLEPQGIQLVPSISKGEYRLRLECAQSHFDSISGRNMYLMIVDFEFGTPTMVESSRSRAAA